MTREAAEQQALFSMIFRYEDRYPALKLVYHIPNGGKALTPRQGRWWKEQGVRAGVPDLFCAVGRYGRLHGLYIEMKTSKGKLSIEQASMIQMLQDQGYRVEVCRSWGEAWNVLVGYLGLPEGLKQV